MDGVRAPAVKKTAGGRTSFLCEAETVGSLGAFVLSLQPCVEVRLGFCGGEQRDASPAAAPTADWKPDQRGGASRCWPSRCRRSGYGGAALCGEASRCSPLQPELHPRLLGSAFPPSRSPSSAHRALTPLCKPFQSVKQSPPTAETAFQLVSKCTFMKCNVNEINKKHCH